MKKLPCPGERFLVPLFLAGWCFACIRVPQTTAFDPALSRTIVDGYPLHTEVFGKKENPPVIVIHGGPGGDLNYLLSLRELSDEYYVLFYDQRGTGLSPREDPAGHSIDRFLMDLDGLINSHAGGRKVRLIGHSWGAMLATAYTARFPEKVSHAVIAEPGILNPESAKEFLSAVKQSQTAGKIFSAIPVFLSAIFVRNEDGDERRDYIMTGMLGLGDGPPYQCEGDRLPQNAFIRGGYRSFSFMLMPLMEDPSLWVRDLSSGVKQFPGKILLLASECSFIGYDYQEKYHRHLFPSSAQFQKLERQGHNMFTIRPEAALRAVRDFLK